MLEVFYGENVFKKQEALAKLKSAFRLENGNLAIQEFWSEDLKLEDLKRKLESNGLFSPKELIVIKNAEGNTELIDYILSLEPAHLADRIDKVIILELSNLDKRTSRYKEITKLPNFKQFEKLSESQLRIWVSEITKNLNLSLNKAVLEKLLRRTNQDQNLILNILEQVSLTNNLGSVELEQNALESFLGPDRNQEAYSLLEESFGKNSLQIVERVKILKNAGQDPHLIIGLLAAQIYSLSLVQIVGASNAAKVGLHPYAASQQAKLLRQEFFKKHSLKELVNIFYKLEHDSKNSRRFEIWKQIESTLLKLNLKSKTT